MDALRRNADMVVRMIVFCAGAWFVVVVLGYDPNSVCIGAIIACIAIYVGEVCGRIVR